MKKFSTLFLLIVINIHFINAQTDTRPWWEMMHDPSVNFYDVQKSFNEYWSGRRIDKGKGWKVYKRWEDFVAPRVFPSGDRSLLVTTSVEYEAIKRSNIMRNANGNWQYIGNTSVPVSGGGAGRVAAIAFHPNDNNTIFIGTPAGGLWRSNNGGASWITNTDQLFNMGVSAVTFDPVNPDIIYMGTGDADGGDYLGQGLLKSTDGGMTWNTTGFSYTFQQNVAVSKILVHPVNNNILIIAASNGVWKSSDAGTSWTNVLPNEFRDLEFKPDDPSVVYAVRAGRFYRSTDTGDTFTQITSGLGNSASMGRLAIAVTPANPNYVYVLASNTGNGFYGLYRSTDAGVNFNQQSSSPNLMGWENNGSDTGGQAWYDLAIAADRNNANTIYVGGVNIWKSTNGGSSWTLSAHWTGSGAPYVHADIHALEINSSNQLFAGCDGGIFRKNITTSNWNDISNNLQIGQIYRIGGSVVDPTLILSGWQDNGTNLSSSPWDQVRGGDGMECIISYTGTNVMYATIYYGQIYKSSNGGNNWNTIVNSNGTGVDEQGNWVTPYIQHPTSSGTILVGKSQVYRTTNAGTSFSQVGSIGGSGNVNALAYAPSDPNYIYVAKNNKLYVSSDGNTFSDRSSGLPVNAAFQYIAVSNVDPQRVWVACSGYSSNAKVYFSPNAGQSWGSYSTGLPNIPTNCIVYQNNTNEALYLGTDLGVFYRDSTMSSWIPFSNGLPNTIVKELEINYPTGKIRAATFGRGLWESDLYSNIQNDIRIAEVVYPTSETCGNSFAPEVVFRNNGDNQVTTAVIGYRIDNNPVQTYNWNGLLAANSNTTISLPAISASAGAHLFKVWTSVPNGTTDSDPSNDTLSVNFTCDPAKVHAVLSIHTDCFGEETAWNIKDGSNTVLYQVNSGTYPGTTTFWHENGIYIDEHVCLSPACYNLTLTDDGGNGMNGTALGCQVDGSYILHNDAGDTLAINATPDCNFGNSITHNFCINSAYFAGFSTTTTTICQGRTIQFSDLSAAGTNSWNWTFPGGTPSSSTAQNPVVTYNTTGTYSATLTAGDGTNTDSYTSGVIISITSTPVLNLGVTQVDCNGNCDGKISPVITGGTGSISYYWNNGSPSDTLSNLCPGNYSLVVMDNLGCSDTAAASITEPALLDVTLNITQASCGMTDGSIASSVTGGTGTYSYLWNDNSTNTSLNNLDIGTYVLQVTDNNGCINTQTAVITNPNAPVITSSAVDETCSGDCDGSLTTSTTGGTGTISLSWSNSLGSDSAYTDLCAGTYVVTATDANSCKDIDTIIINGGYIYPNATFITSDTVVDIGQTVNFINMGGSVATFYTWDFGDGSFSYFSSSSHAYADTGVYNISFVISNHNCNDTGYFQIIVIDASSILEHPDDLMKVYPNPTAHTVTLDFGNLTIFNDVEIFDNRGRMIRTIPMNGVNKITVNVSDLSDGIYHFRVLMNDTPVSKKVIIKKW